MTTLVKPDLEMACAKILEPKTDCVTIEVDEENNWRPVPGLTSRMTVHADGTLRTMGGKLTYRYDPQWGLYAPVGHETVKGYVLMPVHLLAAVAWLPAPDLSWFEIQAYRHRLVKHADGNNLNNAADNLGWVDCPGDGDPAFLKWLMAEPPWCRKESVPKCTDGGQFYRSTEGEL